MVSLKNHMKLHARKDPFVVPLKINFQEDADTFLLELKKGYRESNYVKLRQQLRRIGKRVACHGDEYPDSRKINLFPDSRKINSFPDSRKVSSFPDS